MAVTEIVNRGLNIFIQSGEAQKTLDTLLAKQKALTEEIKKTANPKELQKLNSELGKLSEPIDRATRKVKGELSPAVKDVDALVKKLGASLRKMSIEDADFSKTLGQYTDAKKLLGELKSGVDQVGAAQKSIGKETFLGSFFGTLAGNLFLKAGEKIKDFFGGVISEALDADEKTARLKGTLDNLGKSGVFERITEKAGQLADKFKFIDDEDILGVFKHLIDYGKLTEKQMNDLLPVIINFATNSRISLDEATSVILKALQGSAKGLKEYGIDIKDAGTESERLSLIMNVLGEKVKGAGEDFQNTAAGGVASTKQQFKELQEEIGTGLLPMLVKLLSFVNKALQGLVTFGRAVSDAFTGNKTIAASLINSAANNPSNQAAQDDVTRLWLNEFKNFQEKVKDAQKKGKLLTATEDDIRKNFIEDLRKNEKSFNLIIEDLNKKGALISERKKDELLNAINSQRGIQKAIQQLETDGSTGVIGISQPDAGGGGGGSKTNKLLEDRKKLLEELAKIEQFLSASTLSTVDKDLQELDIKYEKLRDLAHGDNVLLLRLQDDFQKEKIKIIQDAARKEVDIWQKQGIDVNKKADELFKQNIDAFKKLSDSIGINAVDAIKSFDANRMAGLELQLIKSRGKEKLKAELALLNEQERQELDKKDLTENEKLLIEEKYRKRRQEAETNFVINQIKAVLDFASQALDVVNKFNEAKNTKENKELEADRLRNEKKKENLDRRLRAGAISQKQYDFEINQLQLKQDKRERDFQLKQFERNKRIAILQAIVNGAQGIVSTFAARPGLADIFTLGVARAIQIALVAGATAAQIANISAQKPQFARGGKLDGRSHAEGGNAIIDGRGHKIAEIERGEGIINKHSMADGNHYTVSGTPSQISSLLNRMHGGVSWASGGSLIPKWAGRKPVPFNFPDINKYYAGGGKFATPSGISAATGGGDINETLILMANTIERLNRKLGQPIKAYTILSDQEEQQGRIAAIRADATLK